MVVSRKPRAKAAPKSRPTLDEKFARILAEPVSTPIGKLTKRAARYFLRKLSGTGPDPRSSVEIVNEVRGDWGERMAVLARRR